MRLAIIGAGSVGGTLGQAWLKHGEEVVWGLRYGRKQYGQCRRLSCEAPHAGGR